MIVRGINRQDTILGEEDRQPFCERLSGLLQGTRIECLAWALIPNPVHLLLRPHDVDLASFKRQLLTGYAVTFNLRHGREGRLFQNRCKPILCEEEPYLLELARCIHLDPLRVRVVASMEDLDRFAWAGHSVVMGMGTLDGQAVDEVLVRFGTRPGEARQRYREFIAAGVAAGQRQELVGGGLRRRLRCSGRHRSGRASTSASWDPANSSIAYGSTRSCRVACGPTAPCRNW